MGANNGRIGTSIVVGDVLRASARFLISYPVLLVPQMVVLVLSILEDLSRATTTVSLTTLVFVIIELILAVIVSGAYPTMVKAALEGQPVPLTGALGHAARKFFVLVAAGTIVGLATLLGAIALIIPGIVIACWFAYTVPVIMIEDKGPLSGMSGSRSFARDKKWSTFLLFLAVFAVALVAGIVVIVVEVGAGSLAGSVAESVVSWPIQVWASVIFAYTYLKYGPSSTPVAPVSESLPRAPPAWLQPTPFSCPACGVPYAAGSRFCMSCGQPLPAYSADSKPDTQPGDGL